MAGKAPVEKFMWSFFRPPLHSPIRMSTFGSLQFKVHRITELFCILLGYYYHRSSNVAIKLDALWAPSYHIWIEHGIFTRVWLNKGLLAFRRMKARFDCVLYTVQYSSFIIIFSSFPSLYSIQYTYHWRRNMYNGLACNILLNHSSWIANLLQWDSVCFLRLQYFGSILI